MRDFHLGTLMTPSRRTSQTIDGRARYASVLSSRPRLRRIVALICQRTMPATADRGRRRRQEYRRPRRHVLAPISSARSSARTSAWFRQGKRATNPPDAASTWIESGADPGPGRSRRPARRLRRTSSRASPPPQSRSRRTARRRSRQRHFSAIPRSMHGSPDPIVEQPVTCSAPWPRAPSTDPRAWRGSAG